ncbi:MAG TPA: hypothetical protein DCE56_12075 [Cyanobacteria bacterium UBA8553]|nr:hypothetical protein [Cyanobacteria bacterium UBA8553]
MQRFLNSAMATWVGTFTSNLNKKSIRELVVEAEDEVEAIVKLDFYDYDETWEHYSFVDIHKQSSLTFVRAFQRVISAFANLKQQTTNNYFGENAQSRLDTF